MTPSIERGVVTVLALAAAGCAAERQPWRETVQPEVFVEVLPRSAELWVDGAPLGPGSRTVRVPDAEATTAACAYLVGPVDRRWRIADKRCGRDFTNAEVKAGYAGFWDKPAQLVYADDAFGSSLE